MKNLIFILYIFLTLSGLSQEAQFSQYTVLDGLPQMQVNGLAQDHKGNVWIATRGGISRFDGNRFENFETISCLPDYAYDIAEDANGTMWIAGQQALFSFDGEGCQRFDYPTWAGADFKFKLSFLPDGSLLGSTGFPTVPWLFKDGTFERFALHIDMDEDKRILNIALDTSRNLMLVAHAERLLVYKEQQLIKEHKIPGAERFFLTEGSLDHSIHQDQLLRVYEDDIIYYRLDVSLELIKNCTHDASGTCNLEPNGSRHNFYDSTLDFVEIFDSQLDQVFRIESLKSRFNKVWDIVDVDGFTFILTDKGLVKWSPERFFNFSEEALPYIWSVIEGDHGEIYAGSFGKGIYAIDDDEIRPINTKVSHCQDIDHLAKHTSGANQIYYQPTKDDLGNIYFATGAGVTKLKDGKAEVFYHHCYPEMSVPHAAISVAYDASTESIISCHCDGVVWLDENAKVIKKLRQQELKNSSCINFAQPHDKSVYFGYSPYVAQYENEEISFLKTKENDQPEEYYCSMIDHTNTLWFGGKHGLSHMKGDSLVAIPFLQDKKIKAMIQHSPTKVFISLSDGIIMWNLEQYYTHNTITYKEYNQSNGYTAIEPGEAGLFIDSKDRLWVTSATELSHSYIASLSYDSPSYTIDVVSINETYTPLSTTKAYLIPDQSNVVDISLSVISMDQSQKYLMTYALDGGAYSKPTPDLFIHAEQLTKGIHEIDVILTNAAGQELASKTFEIEIDILWTKDPRFPFFLLVCLFLFLLLILGLLYRYIQAKREKEELEHHTMINEISKKNLADLNIQLLNENKALQYRITRSSNSAYSDSKVLRLGPKQDVIMHPMEIIYIQSDRNRLQIHLDNESVSVYMPLKQLKELLPENSFAQINRSTIINIHKITFKSVHDVKMTNNDMLSITKSGRAELEYILSLL